MAAAAELRALNVEHEKEDSKRIGMATLELWRIRDRIYSLRPEVTRDIVTESRSAPQRFEDLDKLNQRATIAEKAGDTSSARASYADLLKVSRYGWFLLLAEAGLYRTRASP